MNLFLYTAQKPVELDKGTRVE